MNAKTVVSADGEVVIPRDVLERLGLEPGQVLEIVTGFGGLTLRRPYEKSGRSTEEILASMRERVTYDGPPLPIEKLNFPSPEEWRGER